MEGLVQVVRRGRRRKAGPEQIKQILPMQPLVRLQSEQLDHRPRLARPPPSGVDALTVDLDAEPPEQLHTHLVASQGA